MSKSKSVLLTTMFFVGACSLVVFLIWLLSSFFLNAFYDKATAVIIVTVIVFLFLVLSQGDPEGGW